MVTGWGADRQPMATTESNAQKQRSARMTGRSFWRTATKADLSDVVKRSRKTDGHQRQLSQARLFPDRRGNELLLHNTSSKDPASDTMQGTAPRRKSGAKPTGCRPAATTTRGDFWKQ